MAAVSQMKKSKLDDMLNSDQFQKINAAKDENFIESKKTDK